MTALLAVSLAGPLMPQEVPPSIDAAERQQPQERFPVLSYPRDKDRVLAEVAGEPLRLGDLVQHIDQRHYPGFEHYVDSTEGPAAGQLLFRSDLIAPWVRQLADIRALTLEARERDKTQEQAEPEQAAALKRSFEGWLEGYVDGLARSGHPTELTQARINRLLADHQLKSGLSCELQGWLDFLVPDDFREVQVRDYFETHARVFGGRVNVAHILIQHRDAGTGILLDEEGQKRALARVADVRARLRPDGSNFAEVAALMSDDNVTASKGGELPSIARFDDRLPAVLCRKVWYMQDDEMSDVLESQYGYHLVKRLGFTQQRFALFTEAARPDVRLVMRRHLQEDMLFGVRQKHRVVLKY